MNRPFSQVDVFTQQLFKGNPLAVVHDADGLTDIQMSQIAHWTHLSETTFLLPPTHPDADYRVRIFTPGGELPFAGHPTLGTAYAWLSEGHAPKGQDIIQECSLGLISVRQHHNHFSFKAPPLSRTGPISDADLATLVAGLDITRSQILHHQWVDNGPGWCALWLDSTDTVLSVDPSHPLLKPYKLGLMGAYPKAHESLCDFEVRAFVGSLGIPEDPVTGSLNAAIAVWLYRDGLINKNYRVSQGTCVNRCGRISIERDDAGIWVGGHVSPIIQGTIEC